MLKIISEPKSVENVLRLNKRVFHNSTELEQNFFFRYTKSFFLDMQNAKNAF